MKLGLVIALVVVWWLCGFTSYLWYWRRHNDVTVGDMLLSLPLGFYGPLMWVITWLVVAPPAFLSRTVMRKREEHPHGP